MEKCLSQSSNEQGSRAPRQDERVTAPRRMEAHSKEVLANGHHSGLQGQIEVDNVTTLVPVCMIDKVKSNSRSAYILVPAKDIDVLDKLNEKKRIMNRDSLNISVAQREQVNTTAQNAQISNTPTRVSEPPNESPPIQPTQPASSISNNPPIDVSGASFLASMNSTTSLFTNKIAEVVGKVDFSSWNDMSKSISDYFKFLKEKEMREEKRARTLHTIQKIRFLGEKIKGMKKKRNREKRIKIQELKRAEIKRQLTSQPLRASSASQNSQPGFSGTPIEKTHQGQIDTNADKSANQRPNQQGQGTKHVSVIHSVSTPSTSVSPSGASNSAIQTLQSMPSLCSLDQLPLQTPTLPSIQMQNNVVKHGGPLPTFAQQPVNPIPVVDLESDERPGNNADVLKRSTSNPDAFNSAKHHQGPKEARVFAGRRPSLQQVSPSSYPNEAYQGGMPMNPNYSSSCMMQQQNPIPYEAINSNNNKSMPQNQGAYQNQMHRPNPPVQTREMYSQRMNETDGGTRGGPGGGQIAYNNYNARNYPPNMRTPMPQPVMGNYMHQQQPTPHFNHHLGNQGGKGLQGAGNNTTPNNDPNPAQTIKELVHSRLKTLLITETTGHRGPQPPYIPHSHQGQQLQSQGQIHQQPPMHSPQGQIRQAQGPVQQPGAMNIGLRQHLKSSLNTRGPMPAPIQQVNMGGMGQPGRNQQHFIGQPEYSQQQSMIQKGYPLQPHHQIRNESLQPPSQRQVQQPMPMPIHIHPGQQAHQYQVGYSQAVLTSPCQNLDFQPPSVESIAPGEDATVEDLHNVMADICGKLQQPSSDNVDMFIDDVVNGPSSGSSEESRKKLSTPPVSVPDYTFSISNPVLNTGSGLITNRTGLQDISAPIRGDQRNLSTATHDQVDSGLNKQSLIDKRERTNLSTPEKMPIQTFYEAPNAIVPEKIVRTTQMVPSNKSLMSPSILEPHVLSGFPSVTKEVFPQNIEKLQTQAPETNIPINTEVQVSKNMPNADEFLNELVNSAQNEPLNPIIVSPVNAKVAEISQPDLQPKLVQPDVDENEEEDLLFRSKRVIRGKTISESSVETKKADESTESSEIIKDVEMDSELSDVTSDNPNLVQNDETGNSSSIMDILRSSTPDIDGDADSELLAQLNQAADNATPPNAQINSQHSSIPEIPLPITSPLRSPSPYEVDLALDKVEESLSSRINYEELAIETITDKVDEAKKGEGLPGSGIGDEIKLTNAEVMISKGADLKVGDEESNQIKPSELIGDSINEEIEKTMNEVSNEGLKDLPVTPEPNRKERSGSDSTSELQDEGSRKSDEGFFDSHIIDVNEKDEILVEKDPDEIRMSELNKTSNEIKLTLADLKAKENRTKNSSPDHQKETDKNDESRKAINEKTQLVETNSLSDAITQVISLDEENEKGISDLETEESNDSDSPLDDRAEENPSPLPDLEQIPLQPTEVIDKVPQTANKTIENASSSLPSSNPVPIHTNDDELTDEIQDEELSDSYKAKISVLSEKKVEHQKKGNEGTMRPLIFKNLSRKNSDSAESNEGDKIPRILTDEDAIIAKATEKYIGQPEKRAQIESLGQKSLAVKIIKMNPSIFKTVAARKMLVEPEEPPVKPSSLSPVSEHKATKMFTRRASRISSESDGSLTGSSSAATPVTPSTPINSLSPETPTNEPQSGDFRIRKSFSEDVISQSHQRLYPTKRGRGRPRKEAIINYNHLKESATAIRGRGRGSFPISTCPSLDSKNGSSDDRISPIKPGTSYYLKGFRIPKQSLSNKDQDGDMKSPENSTSIADKESPNVTIIGNLQEDLQLSSDEEEDPFESCPTPNNKIVIETCKKVVEKEAESQKNITLVGRVETASDVKTNKKELNSPSLTKEKRKLTEELNHDAGTKKFNGNSISTPTKVNDQVEPGRKLSEDERLAQLKAKLQGQVTKVKPVSIVKPHGEPREDVSKRSRQNEEKRIQHVSIPDAYQRARPRATMTMPIKRALSLEGSSDNIDKRPRYEFHNRERSVGDFKRSKSAVLDLNPSNPPETNNSFTENLLNDSQVQHKSLSVNEHLKQLRENLNKGLNLKPTKINLSNTNTAIEGVYSYYIDHMAELLNNEDFKKIVYKISESLNACSALKLNPVCLMKLMNVYYAGGCNYEEKDPYELKRSIADSYTVQESEIGSIFAKINKAVNCTIDELKLLAMELCAKIILGKYEFTSETNFVRKIYGIIESIITKFTFIPLKIKDLLYSSLFKCVEESNVKWDADRDYTLNLEVRQGNPHTVSISVKILAYSIQASNPSEKFLSHLCRSMIVNCKQNSHLNTLLHKALSKIFATVSKKRYLGETNKKTSTTNEENQDAGMNKAKLSYEGCETIRRAIIAYSYDVADCFKRVALIFLFINNKTEEARKIYDLTKFGTNKKPEFDLVVPSYMSTEELKIMIYQKIALRKPYIGTGKDLLKVIFKQTSLELKGIKANSFEPVNQLNVLTEIPNSVHACLTRFMFACLYDGEQQTYCPPEKRNFTLTPMSQTDKQTYFVLVTKYEKGFDLEKPLERMKNEIVDAGINGQDSKIPAHWGYGWNKKF